MPESLVIRPETPEIPLGHVKPAMPTEIPDFRSMLQDVKVYDLPVTSKVSEGLELVDAPIAAFKYADNWYVTPKMQGQISTNPKDWSLVTDSFEYHPNTRFYHEAADVKIQEPHVDMIHDIGSNLNAKHGAGALKENAGALTADEIAKIIVSKEKANGGLRLDDGAPIHDFVKEHGLETFKATHQENMAASYRLDDPVEVREARDILELKQRLALDGETGAAFQAKSHGGSLGAAFDDPRERVFYARHPEDPAQLRRVKIGFDELLMPDGTRVHQPGLHETNIPVADALKEIGERAHIGHAPQDFSDFMRTGDPAALERYGREHLASEFNARHGAEEYFKATDRFHQTTTNHLMGEELTGKEFTTQAWHRIMRPEDYVVQAVGNGAAGAEGIEKSAARLFDSKRADYFLVREHPDYTASLHDRTLSKYKGPHKQLVFLKGDPAGVKPADVKFIDLGDRFGGGFDAVATLREHGIHPDGKLLKIGQDEYATLWNERGLNQHFKDFQLRQQTARDTIQETLLSGVKFGADHPLSEPIRFENGKLVGDVNGLSSNGLYKIGEDHFVHIEPEFTFGKDAPKKFDFTTYKKTSGGIESLGRESCVWEGEFEHKLADLVRQKGALTQASEQEAFDVAKHLHTVAQNSADETAQAFAHRGRDGLMRTEKTKLPEGMGTRLQQAAEGTLECEYRRFHPDKVARNKPKPKNEKPSAPAAETPAADKTGSTVAGEVNTAERSTSRTVAQDTTRAAEKSEGAIARFMKNEKWMGKKGLAFAAGAVVVVGAAYGATKIFGKDQEEQPWTDRVSGSAPLGNGNRLK